MLQDTENDVYCEMCIGKRIPHKKYMIVKQ